MSIKVTFIDKMGNDLTIVNAARVSFGKAASELTEKDQKLIKYLVNHDHLSPFEHCQVTVLIECPLYIRSQIHRHRTFAYNEISRRYTAENIEFYIPPTDDIRTQSKNNKQASDGPLSFEDAILAQQLLIAASETCLATFNKLLSYGVSREQARGVLPQSTMTQFYMSGNLRNWAHFVKLRDDAHAQKEVQYIAQSIRSILLECFPHASQALFSNKVTK